MPAKINIQTVEMLDALCGLIAQYMPSRTVNDVKVFDHQNMSAGEDAVDVLIKYGLAEDSGRDIVPNQKFWDIQDEFSDFRKGIK